MNTALIAFDSKTLALILQKMTAELGFESSIIETVEDFESRLQKNPPTVILTDWTFKQTPLEEWIEKTDEQIPFILVSEKHSKDDLQKAASLKLAEYIMKPFDHDILQSKLSLAGVL